MTTYAVTFERVGRNRNMPVLTTEGADADALADAVYRYARPHLHSRDVQVDLDLDADGTGSGTIFCGVQIGGRFTIAPAAPITPGVAWILKLRTFAGVVASASHYMASLTGRVEDVEVGYILDVADAAALSTPDFTWKPGDWSTSFRSEPAARAAGIAAFRHLAGPRDILINEDGPGHVLAGAHDLVVAGLAFGDVEDDDAWYRWLDDTFVKHEHDKVFGRGAPPSVRRSMSAIVRRDADGAWQVTTEALV